MATSEATMDDLLPGDEPGGHQDEPREAEPTAPAEERPEERAWSLPRRVGFRFLASYLVLYLFPFPVDFIPGLGGFLNGAVSSFWKSLVPWVAAHVLGVEGELFMGPTGSGDTTFEVVKLFTMVVLAAVGAVVWSLLDRRRRHYRRAGRWLAAAVALYLGLVMLNYGLAKVIPTQFSTPSLVRLLTPYGDSSPMGIVWTFMGLVPAYTVFAGLGEVVGGLLLFLPRTRTLGAAILVAVLTNVVMLNFAFDVPVKLFSSQLLLMAVGLVLLDARRLAAVFLTEGPAPAARREPLVRRRWARVALTLAVLFVVGSALYGSITWNWKAYGQYGAGRPVSSLYGIYEVETFVLDGEERPPLLTDEVRWRRLVVDRALPVATGSFERPGRVSVQKMDDRFVHHPIELDEEARTIHLLPGEHPSLEAAREAGEEPLGVLTWERPEDGVLVLRGTWEGQELEARLRWRDPEDFELTGRGFRWINETPHNV